MAMTAATPMMSPVIVSSERSLLASKTRDGFFEVHHDRERLDRIEIRRPNRRIGSEYHADGDRETHARC